MVFCYKVSYANRIKTTFISNLCDLGLICIVLIEIDLLLDFFLLNWVVDEESICFGSWWVVL